MNRYTSLILIGVAVILIPLSGFPMKNVLEMVCGVGVIIIASKLRKEYTEREVKAEVLDPHRSTYVENTQEGV